MTRARRRALPCTLRDALALLGLLTACGTGGEVDMGRLTLLGTTTPGQPSSGSCSGKPCANYTGTRIFAQDGATDADADTFATASSEPSASDPSVEPVLIYPSDETMLPVNLSLVRFAWTPQGNSRFALDFTGANTSVRVVTAAQSFTPSDDEWDWIAESNRGGQVQVVLRGFDSDSPAEVRQSGSIELRFADDGLDGSVYYWSTGSQGIMQARIDDPVPVRVYTDPSGADAATCTGCHTISRDGKRLALSSDKPELRELSLPELSVILDGSGAAPAPKPAGMDMKGMPTAPASPPPIPASWSTFSPDGRMLLTAQHGKLHLIDADSGAAIGDPMGVALPKDTIATHPDWSPKGDMIALTLAGKGGDKETEGGSIALLSYASDGTFGAPAVLVASQGGDDNNYFPSFSPDGRFIAYVNASGDSQDATSARIRLVNVASGLVSELTRLNERVGAEDGVLALGNTMPTWAPAPGGTYWLAFSSLRAYSDLRPADAKKDQLWIAAIDPTQSDPSFAAFWAPFQSLDQGNHRAFFTPATKLTHCGDTCSAHETCGDGVDNDCDCVVDDCSQEICDNGIDDDGDGRVDKADPACPAP